MKKYIFTAMFLSQVVIAQNLPVEKIIKNFYQPKVEWNIPIGENLAEVQWKERKSTLSSEGIRTFVAYSGEDLVGVISIFKDKISGNITWQGKHYSLKTKNGTLLIENDKTHGDCGNCEGGACGVQGHHHKTEEQSSSSKNVKHNAKANASHIPSDALLRVYRLAILVDYYAFEHLGNNREDVKIFLANTEVNLNEIYMRDLGVKFQLVLHDDLIRDTPEKRIYPDNYHGDAILRIAGLETNLILGNQDVEIGRQKYDIGISLTKSNSSEVGLAYMGAVFNNYSKASAYAEPSLSIIAHELGHLFGADHTFTTGGRDGLKTEPEKGTSVMSYGSEQRNFFSLYSIQEIRKRFAENPWYYSSEERNQEVLVLTGEKTPQYDSNIVYAIDTKNQSPEIDRTIMKAKYQLPPKTSFQFDIKATDPEGNPLLYWAHQTDIHRGNDLLNSKTRFQSKMPTKDNVLRFDPEYRANLIRKTNELVNYTAFKDADRGEFTFWIGAGDADISEGYTTRQNHNTRIDVMPIKVEVVEGKPFQITSPVGNNGTRQYLAGQKTTLTWQVDEKIFGKDSRVRILMSDDFGQSWKYLLEPDTENDGSHEVIIPNQEVTGKIIHERIPGYLAQSRKGLFRIEVINHIATAITDGGAKPDNGGFEIAKNKIELKNLPEMFVKAKRDALPPKAEITATTTCANPNINLDYQEKESGKYITRTWEAKDKCNNVAYFVQNIEVEGDDPTLSTAENVRKTTPILYPNPAKESFSIKNMENITAVKVFTLSGQLIRTFEPQERYPISNLSKGIYIIVIENKHGHETKKLIKQ